MATPAPAVTKPTPPPAAASAAAAPPVAAPEPPDTAAPSASELAPAVPPAAVERWPDLQWLPCNIEVKLSVPRFTVGDVLRMAPQSVVETRWQQNADVPVRANGQLLAWAEFEGVDDKLAVRITRLA